jgi:DNA-directed RNA polymerase specialized sigma24 family protein
MVVTLTEETSNFWAEVYSNEFNSLILLTRYKLTDGDLDKAHETVNEAFTRSMRYIKHPQRIVNLPGYLWTTTMRVWFTRFKAERIAVTDSLDDPKCEGLENKLPAVDIEEELLEVLELRQKFNQAQEKKGPLSEREDRLLMRHLQGFSCLDIANELGEDRRLISVELNALRAKVRHRLQEAGKSARAKPAARTRK